MPPRTYELGGRRAAIAATREKILEATRALIGGKGDLAEFSMDAVAERAGVSRMTVYNQFESRTGLLDALADHLADKGGMQRLREVFGARDLEHAVRQFVDVFVGFWASDRSTLRRMRAMGVLFPSRHGGLPGRDAWRLEAASTIVARFGGRSDSSTRALDSGAAALLSALTSFDTFDALCTESRGPEEVARMVSDAALTLMGVGSRSVRPIRRRRERGGRAGTRRAT